MIIFCYMIFDEITHLIYENMIRYIIKSNNMKPIQNNMKDRLRKVNVCNKKFYTWDYGKFYDSTISNDPLK